MAYGFPLGPQLKDLILSLPDSEIEAFMRERSLDTSLIPKFKAALRYGDYGTIDYFLERKKSFRELGAYYIVKVIASRENHDHIFPQRDIYADFFHLLEPEHPDTSIPPMTVVTLNYDRSLEYYLQNNPEFNCPDDLVEHAREKAARLPIIHAHGCLGSLAEVAYGEVGRTAASLQSAASHIKIISDRLEDSPDFQLARESIKAAANVLFLGFGYHERTLSALMGDIDLANKTIWGTAVSLPDAKKSIATQFFRNRIQYAGNLPCSAFMEHLGLSRSKFQQRKVEQGGGHVR
jgi:hypothetical protein